MSIAVAIDALIVTILAALAWKALSTGDLFRSAVLYIAFGLLMAVAWARLAAPDLALAEAAIGAGLTGVLLVHVVRVMSGPPEHDDDGGREP